MSIWVVGAGPVGTLPKNTPRLVIFVNGAVAHTPNLALRGAEKWLFVAGNVYREVSSPRVVSPDKACTADSRLHLVSRSEDDHLEAIRGLIRTYAPYEKLVVRESLGFPAGKTVKMFQALNLAREHGAFGYAEIMRRIRQFMSLGEVCSMVLGPRKMSFESLKRLASKKRMLSGPYLKPSSGVLAVLLALDVIEPGEKIDVLGITFDDASYPFDTSEHSNRQAHLNADITILSSIRRKQPGLRLVIHDDRLRKATNWA